MSEQHSASPKERHDQLMALLSDNYAGLMKAQFGNTTALLVALGWLASSAELQKLLHCSLALAVVSTIAVVVLTVIYVAWVLRIYTQSSRLITELKALRFMPITHFESRILTRGVIASYCGTQIVLYTLILVITWIVHFQKS